MSTCDAAGFARVGGPVTVPFRPCCTAALIRAGAHRLPEILCIGSDDLPGPACAAAPPAVPDMVISAVGGPASTAPAARAGHLARGGDAGPDAQRRPAVEPDLLALRVAVAAPDTTSAGGGRGQGPPTR